MGDIIFFTKMGAAVKSQADLDRVRMIARQAEGTGAGRGDPLAPEDAEALDQTGARGLIAGRRGPAQYDRGPVDAMLAEMRRQRQ